MRQSWRRTWHRPRSATTILAAAASSLALLLPFAVGGGTAAAQPAAGYTVSLIQPGQDETAVAVNSTTDTVYLGSSGFDTLAVVDGSTNAVTDTITLSDDVRAIAVDPVTDTVYVAVGTSSTTVAPAVVVIDGATDTVTDTIPLAVESLPNAIGVDSNTDTVFVVEEEGNAVAVIDGSTDSVTTTVSTGAGTRPYALAVDETAGLVWVGELSGTVIAISEASDSVTETTSLGGVDVESIAVDPTIGTVFAGTSTDEVAVITESTGAVSGYIDTTAEVSALAVDPSAETLFASSGVGSTAGTTWVIDETSNDIADTVPRGGLGIAADTATGSAYAAGSDVADAVWMLTPSAANAWSPVIYSSGADFTVGTYGSFGISGSALPAASYTETGALPAGVTLSTAGVLSGTPAAGTAGLYSITVTASNGVAPDYSQAFTLEVDDVPAITSADEATFTTGVADSFTMTAYGYPPPAFSESGALPSGVTFSSEGVLSGTPPVGSGGVYPLQITAANSLGSATQAFTLTVNDAPAITSADQTTFHVGAAGSFTMAQTGYPPPTFSEAGTLPSGVSFSASGVLSGTPAAGTAGSYPLQITATSTSGTLTQAFTLTVAAGSYYVPLTPVRILDTRNGTGGYDAPVGPGGTLSLPVEGVDGVPSSGVTAVVVNVTVTEPTDSSFVTVYPDGTALPTASNLNFTAGETIANLVTVPVGADGDIDFYNHTGSTDLVADLEGYYTTNGTGSAYVPMSPVRILDTRNGTGGATTLAPGEQIGLHVIGIDGVPSSGVTAVVLNVTATDTSASSFITVYPDGTALPNASNLNFTAGETIANLVVVPVIDGQIDFYNHAGSTDLVADLEGYYTSSGTGSSYVPLSPTRILDTRNDTGGYDAPVGAGASISLQMTGTDDIPGSVTAVVLNVTVTEPTDSSFVTVYPDGQAVPNASNINFTAGETIPNLVVVQVGADGAIDLYNHTGSTDLVADLEGYFTSP